MTQHEHQIYKFEKGQGTSYPAFSHLLPRAEKEIIPPLDIPLSAIKFAL